jgi:NIPSNAP
MKKLLLLMLFALLPMVVLAPHKDTRCYEMRTYYAAEGKLDELNARFRNHTCKLFEKHGMQNIGYWMPQENPDRKLIYLLAYPSREARDKAWKEFMADPDWQAAYKASELNGKLVAKSESIFLSATDYSPAVQPSVQPPRVFELRIYTASPGNLGALDDRFRNHTMKLFSKHGMQNFGYWHLLAGQKGAENTLIYLLAHKSKDAAEASFKAFRTDPDWIAARAASEKKAGGSLTEAGMAGVKSVFMNPTDYSQTK